MLDMSMTTPAREFRLTDPASFIAASPGTLSPSDRCLDSKAACDCVGSCASDSGGSRGRTIWDSGAGPGGREISFADLIDSFVYRSASDTSLDQSLVDPNMESGGNIRQYGGEKPGTKRHAWRRPGIGKDGHLTATSRANDNNVRCDESTQMAEGVRRCIWDIDLKMPSDTYDENVGQKTLLVQEINDIGDTGLCDEGSCNSRPWTMSYIEWRVIFGPVDGYQEKFDWPVYGGCRMMQTTATLQVYGFKHPRFREMYNLIQKMQRYRPKKEPKFSPETGRKEQMVIVSELRPTPAFPGHYTHLFPGRWKVVKPNGGDRKKWLPLYFNDKIPPDFWIHLSCGVDYDCCSENAALMAAQPRPSYGPALPPPVTSLRPTTPWVAGEPSQPPSGNPSVMPAEKLGIAAASSCSEPGCSGGGSVWA